MGCNKNEDRITIGRFTFNKTELVKSKDLLDSNLEEEMIGNDSFLNYCYHSIKLIFRHKKENEVTEAKPANYHYSKEDPEYFTEQYKLIAHVTNIRLISFNKLKL